MHTSEQQVYKKALTDAGFDVEWHDYPMAHAVCPQEIDDIRAWLLRILS